MKNKVLVVLGIAFILVSCASTDTSNCLFDLNIVSNENTYLEDFGSCHVTRKGLNNAILYDSLMARNESEKEIKIGIGTTILDNLNYNYLWLKDVRIFSLCFTHDEINKLIEKINEWEKIAIENKVDFLDKELPFRVQGHLNYWNGSYDSSPVFVKIVLHYSRISGKKTLDLEIDDFKHRAFWGEAKLSMVSLPLAIINRLCYLSSEDGTRMIQGNLKNIQDYSSEQESKKSNLFQ